MNIAMKSQGLDGAVAQYLAEIKSAGDDEACTSYYSKPMTNDSKRITRSMAMSTPQTKQQPALKNQATYLLSGNPLLKKSVS